MLIRQSPADPASETEGGNELSLYHAVDGRATNVEIVADLFHPQASFLIFAGPMARSYSSSDYLEVTLAVIQIVNTLSSGIDAGVGRFLRIRDTTNGAGLLLSIPEEHEKLSLLSLIRKTRLAVGLRKWRRKNGAGEEQ